MSVKIADFSTLGSLTQLGDGGEGVVYRAPNFPGDVYKEYKSAVAHEVDSRALEQTIGLLDQLAAPALAFVSGRSAWPHTLVQKNGTTCGFLMQEIPDEFGCEHGMVGRRRPVLTDWNKLVTRSDWMANDNIDSTVPQFDVKNKQDEKVLIHLLLDLCRLFAHLHEHQIVVGDVSGRNILWKADAEPSVFLIDCDGFRAEGQRAVTLSKQSPDWFDPHLVGDTTLESDRYKLAVAVYRAYFSDAFGVPSAPKASPGAQAQKILKLAQQGTGPDQRTTAAQWCELLDEIESGRPRRSWSRKRPLPASTPIPDAPRPGRIWTPKGS